MSPQPDWGRGFVLSEVAASKDAGSLDFSSEAWKDGVAGAFSGAFSGMKAKGFFADEAGASGEVGARRLGFRDGGGEKTNSGATGAAAPADTGPDLVRRDAGAGQTSSQKIRLLRDVDAGLWAEQRQGRGAEDALRFWGRI